MRERRLLLLIAAAMVALAAAYTILRPQEPGPLPTDTVALAQFLRRHPTDWRAASALSERALDSRLPARIALWRSAHELAMQLGPVREAPRLEFARGAFFHWTELSPADRRAALDAVAPLLREPRIFFDLVRPLWELTGDMNLLRRWQPHTAESMETLRDIAATNGLFADYRALRDELAQTRIAEYQAKAPRLSAVDLIGALPHGPYDASLQPIFVTALAELHRRPLTEDPHRPGELDAFLDYALRHKLQPLDGVDAVMHIEGAATPLTRLHLARAAGNASDVFNIRMASASPLPEPKPGEWQGLYNGTIGGRAWVDLELRGPSTITVEKAEGDEIPPYVEVYVDDVLVAEGEVPEKRTFALPAAAGMHRLEVRVPDGLTRNRGRRAVRVVSVLP